MMVLGWSDDFCWREHSAGAWLPAMGCYPTKFRLGHYRLEDRSKTGVRSPQQQQDVPRVIAIVKKFGVEILPPSGA
jgi:hypothetical protein